MDIVSGDLALDIIFSNATSDSDAYFRLGIKS